MEQKVNTKRTILLLIIVFFFQGIFTNMHHPLMPFYVRELELSDHMFGFFFAFMNLGTMLGGPYWGRLGDKGHKRKVVFSGLTIYGLGQLFFGLGNVFNQWFLSIFRFLSGFGVAAALTVILSEIIRLSDSKSRSKNIMFATASLALGGSLGFYFGGFLNHNPLMIKLFNTDNIAYALAIQCILNVLLATLTLFVFEKDVKVKTNNVKLEKRSSIFEGFKEIKNLSLGMFFFLLSLTFITVAATNIDKYLDVYFSDLGYLSNDIGQYKMVVGIVSIIATIGLVPLLLKFRNQLFLISVLQVISAIVVFVVFGSASSHFITFVYTILMIYIIIKAVYAPLEQDYIAKQTSDEKIGTIMGIRQSFFSIGTIIGPIFGGFVYEFDKQLLFYTSAIFFILSIGLLILSGIFRKKDSLNNNVEIDSL